jgi:hypothetical protein
MTSTRKRLSFPPEAASAENAHATPAEQFPSMEFELRQLALLRHELNGQFAELEAKA